MNTKQDSFPSKYMNTKQDLFSS